MKKKIIEPIDFYFSQFVSNENKIIMLVAACISYESKNGHIFLPIQYFKKNCFFFNKKNITQKILTILNKKINWSSELLSHQAFSDGSTITPLVLFEEKIYLYKLWNAEKKILKYIHSNKINNKINIDKCAKMLNILFPQKKINYQKISVALTLINNITFILGGPGTGKTTTILKIIIMLIKTSQKIINIQLSAPTGKATSRLKEILNDSDLIKYLSEKERKQINYNPITIHELLGISKKSNKIIFNKKNPLIIDVLIIDEISMIDIIMMKNILSALSSHTKLILIGDQNQLKPIELGSNLKSICYFAKNQYSYQTTKILKKITQYFKLQTKLNKKKYSLINDKICVLQKNYRFQKNSSIYILSQAIYKNKKEVFEKLFKNLMKNICFYKNNSPIEYNNMISNIILNTEKYWKKISKKEDIREIIKEFQKHQVLCIIKYGIFGIHFINKILDETIYKNKKINTFININNNIWYPGKPIIITKNDKLLELSNGEIGITNINKKNILQVSFLGSNNNIKNIPIHLLQYYNTAWAITVHKAQGSEFNHITLILPNKNISILNKDILYTAITRSKKKINIFATKKIFISALIKK